MASRLRKSMEYRPKPGESELELVKKYGPNGLFEDPEFQPTSKHALAYDGHLPEGHIPVELVEWLRPSEFVPAGKKPAVFLDGAEAGDVKQGALGDCWFLSALCCVATRKELLKNLFASTEYAAKGIYTIRFFKNGKWKHVNIDDRIPCDSTADPPRPIYARCVNENELWVMLLEKAYAKLHGRCYRNLESGTMTFALKDMTGGDPQVYDLNDPLVKDQCLNGFLWQKIKLWQKQGCLMGTCFSVPRGQKKEVEFDGGIIAGHAYAIVDVKEHTLRNNDTLKFLRVRNPWGMKEWTGPWADGSPEWEDVRREEVRDDYPDWMKTYEGKDDGEFWMLFEDLCRYFNTIYVCVLFPPSWTEERMKGRWEPDTCGGCPNKINEWWMSPTYAISVQSKTQVMVTVSQKDKRMYGNKKDETDHAQWNKYEEAVGFLVSSELAVARCKQAKERNPELAMLRGSDMVAKGFPFRKDRDVSLANFPLILEPTRGPYILIPMTFMPGKEGAYYLTLRSNKPLKIERREVQAIMEDQMLDEEEDEDEEELEELKKAEDKVQDFPEKPIRLQPSQREIIRMCQKETEYEPWVKHTQDQGFKFEDPTFLPDDKSIFINHEVKGDWLDEWISSGEHVVWLRPSQIQLDSYSRDKAGANTSPAPPMVFRDFKIPSPFLVQGALSDTWFLGAIAALAGHGEDDGKPGTRRAEGKAWRRGQLLRELFVGSDEQLKLCAKFGVYTCRFYKQGKWHEVMVDDRLPCTPSGHYLFSRGKDPRELWVPLLEKAYAKLHGCYEALKKGTTSYAFKDLTEGAPQVLRLNDPEVETRRENGMLWQEMHSLLSNQSIIACYIRQQDWSITHSNGLVPGHSYAVMEMSEEFNLSKMGLKSYREKPTLKLIRLMNPWGAGEWTGAWSRGHPLWDTYAEVKERLRYEEKDDGSFWMEQHDFFSSFSALAINRLFKDTWTPTRMKGRWLVSQPAAGAEDGDSAMPVSNAQGAPTAKDPGAWLSNPQFLLYVKQRTSAFIFLSQRDTRMRSEAEQIYGGKKGLDDWRPNSYSTAIGFLVAKASVMKEKGARMRKSDFVALSGFNLDRDVSTPFTLQLQPQDSPYVVIPMTMEPNQHGPFVLTIWHKGDRRTLLVRGGEPVRGPLSTRDAAGEEDEWEDWTLLDKDEEELAEKTLRSDKGGAGGGASFQRRDAGGPTSSKAVEGTARGGGGGGGGGGGAGGGVEEGALYSALETLCRELGPRLTASQKQALGKALGL